jgi:hypothetical protein
VPPTSLSKLPRARGGARRAGVDRRAGSGTTSTDVLIMELTEQECRAALLIFARAWTSLACDVGSAVEDATVVRLPVPGRCSMTGARSSAAAAGRLRHRGSPVLLAGCHLSSIGLASVSRQVRGRHSLTPSGLPAMAGGPGRRGCRICSGPSAATGPARRRGQQGGAAAVGAEPARARQVQDRCPGSGG